MSYKTFRRVAGISFGLFILIILLWGPISIAVAETSGCTRISGACGAVLTIFGIYGRNALVLFVTIIFAVIIVLRSRSLGLPLLITLNGLSFLPYIQQLVT